jgi:hypothetical protein
MDDKKKSPDAKPKTFRDDGTEKSKLRPPPPKKPKAPPKKGQ